MDSRALLAALQHADSFFPSGTVSFSWGLEALRADGLVRNADDAVELSKNVKDKLVTLRIWRDGGGFFITVNNEKEK